MQTTVKLHYFPLYGRGEAIRLFLSHLKIEYEQVVIDPPFLSQDNKKKWIEIKDNYEFKMVPMLQIDGHKISQSRSILRYLAAKHGFAPTNAYDVWRNQSLIDHYADIEAAFVKTYFAEDKEAALKELIKQKLLHTYSVLEKRLKENSSQEYLVGNKLTVADILWVNFFWSACMNQSYDKGKIEEAKARLKSFPTISNYIEKRKDDFPRFKSRKPQPI